MGISQQLERGIATGHRWNVSCEAFLSCAAVNPPGWEGLPRTVPFLEALALKTRSIKSFLANQAVTHCSRKAGAPLHWPHPVSAYMQLYTEAFTFFYSLYIMCNGFCELFVFPVSAIPTQISWQAVREPSAIYCTFLVYTNNYKFALSKDYFCFGKSQLQY